MKRLLYFYVGLLPALFLCACEKDNASKPPVAIEVPDNISDKDSLLAVDAGATKLMLKKAIEFRKAMSIPDGKKAGIYIYSKTIQAYKSEPEKLVAGLALLGFTDVYLSVTKAALDGSDSSMASWLKTFNEKAHSYGLLVHALRFSDTKMYVSNDKVYEDAGLIKLFNASAMKQEQRFDAVSADLEPHVLKQGGSDTPAGLTYFWDSNNNYGIGKSNDLLLKRTLDILQLAKQEIEPVPLSEAISFMYQPKVNDRQLQYGGAKDFLMYCNHVIVMSYYNKKDVIWNRAKPVLGAALDLQESVYICIKTSLNTYGDGGEAVTSLQPEGWNYLLETLKYLNENAKEMKSLKGICIFEYEGLEIMWKWINDKN